MTSRWCADGRSVQERLWGAFPGEGPSRTAPERRWIACPETEPAAPIHCRESGPRCCRRC
jgi:hypothetical protein